MRPVVRGAVRTIHMAREEHDREDLLGEATAYLQRIELILHPSNERVFIGFRRDGCASFYFGAEPVYHFNTQCALRRAHANGLIVKAESGALATLDRRRAAGEVQLLRHDLNPQETQIFLQRVHDDLQRLSSSVNAGEFELVGQVPADADIVVRIRSWLANLAQVIPAQSPGVG